MQRRLARQGGGERVGLYLAKECPLAQRLALVGEGDDHPVAGANESGELVLRLGEAARGDRRALRLELECLPAREGVELRRAYERHRVELLLLPDGTDVIRLPDDVGCAIDGGDEVAGRKNRRNLVLVVGRQLHVHEITAPLRGRIDGRLREWMQGALRERRERAHLLDLVAEQLDPQRLPAGRGEDVDDAAPDGELPTLLDPVDAFVAGERQLRCESVHARLVADPETHRERPRAERGHALRQRCRGSTHQATVGKHVERAGSLSDQVRRRLEAGGRRDATTREQRHPIVAEIPRRPVGCVAGIRILGQQHHEAAAQLLVEGREHERQSCIRDARARGQRLDERLEALTRRELGNEDVKRRRVHANGGNAPRGAIVAACPGHIRNLPQGHSRVPGDTLAAMP